jgi:hypothetical protein
MTQAKFQWTQDSWGPEDGSVAPRASSRNEKLAWFGVIALAVVAFEVTADPAVTTILGCLKFGWEEVRLARWLKRTDPDRKRGRICSRFYLAWGFWRVSLVATAMMFILVFVHAAIEGKQANGGPAGPPPGFIGATLLALAGFLLSAMVSSLAVISALRHRVRVWLGPEVKWAREESIWPPQSAMPRRRVSTNRTKVILLSALITGGVIGFLVVLLPLSHAFPQQQAPDAVLFVFMMGFMIGGPFLMLCLLELLGSRMIAPTPEACWADAGEFHRSGA